MIEYDVNQVYDSLQLAEYNRSQDIRNACKSAEKLISDGFAIAYKIGLIEGRKKNSKTLHATFARNADLTAQVQELERANEMYISFLRMLAKPQKDIDIEDLIASVQKQPGARTELTASVEGEEDAINE